MEFHEFEALNNKGQSIKMENYKGKKVLIVNTASKCGFTPQYNGLEELYKKNQEKLVILGFPCNQFGAQEPGADEEIQEFCQLNFGVTFPLFKKVEVNGENSHPLFEFLKTELPGLLGSKKIKWNFTKFLIDENGTPMKRFAPKDSPESIGEYL